uniref:Uncharacterized protein n=1 Tax=Anguilla anguilla TaxID=7936 RepID=A0A0E9VH39_ANGAN
MGMERADGPNGLHSSVPPVLTSSWGYAVMWLNTSRDMNWCESDFIDL